MAADDRRFALPLAALALCLCSSQAAAAAGGEIAEVQLSSASFDPSSGQRVEISYRLDTSDRVSIHVYDPDDGRVRTLVDSEERAAGEHRAAWDGLDVDGRVVPDEAYYFVIETASGGVWDPRTFSGGAVGDLVDVELDREGGTLTYRLPAAARVLCRLGIHDGPMLKTLVDWKPRIAGVVTEYWQGWDEDRVVRFWGDPAFSGIVTYVELPEASVIAFGNRAETYREVKLGRARERPQKPERPRRERPGERLRPDGLLPPAWGRAPVVSLTLPDVAAGAAGATEAEAPEVGDRVRVRVDVDPADRERLANDQFEIIFYVDNVFFAEAERGYTPLNWVWETHQLPAGEHVLTVNLSSFKGQVGVASRRVRVGR